MHRIVIPALLFFSLFIAIHPLLSADLPRQGGRFFQMMVKKAESGNPEAQANYGSILFRQNDMEGAIKWFKKSAEQGYIDAYDRLSQVYFKQKKYDEALETARTGALKGSQDCMYNLGVFLLERPDLQPKDSSASQVEAYKWLYILANSEYVLKDKAQGLLEKLQGRLSDDQINEAQSLIQEFQPESEPEPEKE